MVDFNDLDEVTQEHDGVSGVYAIVHDDGRRYIGSSVNVLHRVKEHRWKLSKGEHCNDKLQKAWAKYGAEAFRFLFVEQSDEQVAREQHHIDTLRACDREIGFNLAPYANGGGGNAVLTAGQVRRIRWERAINKTTYPTLAEQFGVTKNTVSRAATGSTWANIGGGVDKLPGSGLGVGNSNAKLTTQQVLMMRESVVSIDDIARFADDFSVTTGCIRSAIEGSTYSQVGGAVSFCQSYLCGDCSSINPNIKLTGDDVREMRKLRRSTGMTFTEIGERYGVKKVAALRAIKGITWAHIVDVEPVNGDSRPGNRKLKDSEVIAMRKRIKMEGLTYRQIGDAYGVTKDTAKQAVTGKTWSHLNEVECPFVWTQ